MNTVEKGLRLELKLMEILKNSSQITHKSGGPNDRGIDLRGRILCAPNPLFICQCKNSELKLSTKYLRELEGTLSNETIGTVGIMATKTEWTNNSLQMFHHSRFPLVGMTINLDDGNLSPIKSVMMNLQFQQLFPMLRVSTKSPYFLSSVV